MVFLRWGFYILILVLSFLPIVRLGLFSTGKKYLSFKYVSISLFVWGIILGIGLSVAEPFILYYASMIKYAFIFLTISMTFIAILRYLEINIPKSLMFFVYGFFMVDLIFGLTNASHQLLLEVPYTQQLVRNDILYSTTGSLFIIHMVITYLFFLGTLFLIIKKLYISAIKDKDYLPFVLVMIVSLAGITLNIIQIYVYTFFIDPTYIIYVLFILVMYFVFTIRDARLIIKMGNNRFLLDNLREMYLIVNHNDEVVDASEALLNSFDIQLGESKPLTEVMDAIQKKAIIYRDSESVIEDYDENKRYIHIQFKDINLPFLKYHGHLILFYDETKIQKSIHDMDYAMTHDLMTGLYNRNYLESIRIKYDQLSGYSCVLFDLDGLKLFNDYLGHEEGDYLLKRFSTVLDYLAKNDSKLMPIRMGGDEFLLIIKSIHLSDIDHVINQMLEMTNDDDPLKHIGFSYGYYINVDNLSFSQVLSNADLRMYQMKESRKEEKKALQVFLKSNSKLI